MQNDYMEDKTENKIELTTSQQLVLNQIVKFIDHPSDRIFILKGYAGTFFPSDNMQILTSIPV